MAKEGGQEPSRGPKRREKGPREPQSNREGPEKGPQMIQKLDGEGSKRTFEGKKPKTLEHEDRLDENSWFLEVETDQHLINT